MKIFERVKEEALKAMDFANGVLRRLEAIEAWLVDHTAPAAEPSAPEEKGPKP